MRWKRGAVAKICTHFRRNRHSKTCRASCAFFYKSSREPWLFIPQTKGGITFSWCLLRKPHSSSRSLSHYRWLWMTGNSMWHLNRAWETPPFCLSNSAAVVSPLPAADEIFPSFQYPVGRVLLKTCSSGGSLGLAACVLWCGVARHFTWTLQCAWNILVPGSLWGGQGTFADLCSAAALPLQALCHALLPVQT